MSKRPMLPILLTAAVAVAAHVPFVSAQESVPESDAVAQTATPTSAISDVASAVRPKVEMDAQYALGRGGYDVKVFFQEDRTFRNLDAHVFYEPLIYLTTEGDGGLRHEILETRDGAQLILNFRVETDRDFLDSTLRDKLMREARRKDRSLENIENKDFAYRIMPLVIHHSWFESTRPHGAGDAGYASHPLSTPDAPTPFTTKGNFNTYFDFETADEARAFVADLDARRDTLRFKYQFAGVSVKTCGAFFTGVQLQSGGRGQDGGGDAGEAQEEGAANYVTRNRVAAIAERAIQTGEYSTRCGNAEWSDYLFDQLVARLGEYETLTLKGGWEALDKLNLFDAGDFRTDFETSATKIKKDVVREQLLKASSEAFGESESAEGGGGLAVGWDDFSIGATGRGATAEATSTSEAKKEVEDFLEKRGIYGDWEGGKFTPKTLSVHTDETLDREWGREIYIKYSFPSEGEATHVIDLLLPNSRYVRYGPGALDELRGDVAVLKQQVAILNGQMSRVSKSYASRRHSHSELSSAEHSHSAYSEREHMHRGIMTRDYELRVRGGEPYRQRANYHRTGISASEYPTASVSSWSVYGECNDESVLPPTLYSTYRKHNVPTPGHWVIYPQTYSHECNYLKVRVVFYHKSLTSSGSYDFPRRRFPQSGHLYKFSPELLSTRYRKILDGTSEKSYFYAKSGGATYKTYADGTRIQESRSGKITKKNIKR